jgi:hypothetical protein
MLPGWGDGLKWTLKPWPLGVRGALAVVLRGSSALTPSALRPLCSEETADPRVVLQDVTTQLREEFGFSGATVQVERYSSEGGPAGPWGAGPLAD